jgi:hypothetical protein
MKKGCFCVERNTSWCLFLDQLIHLHVILFKCRWPFEATIFFFINVGYIHPWMSFQIQRIKICSAFDLVTGLSGFLISLYFLPGIK